MKLSRVPSTVSPRPVWSAFVLGGIERLTDGLRRGDEFTEADVRDLQAVVMRLDALKAALEMRIQQQTAMDGQE